MMRSRYPVRWTHSLLASVAGGLLFLFACRDASREGKRQVAPVKEVVPASDSLVAQETDSIPAMLAASNLVDIQQIDPSIRVELKYATADNFMKQRLYFELDKLYLQRDVAERLAKCQRYLQKIAPGHSLLVYDGVRPLSVQRAMWEALDSIPVKDRVKFVSNPANGSIHNYGAAVDLTICNAAGEPLDMGAGYDDIRLIAYPKLEPQFLATGELSEQQVENRRLLRKVMAHQQFRNIPTEWWHFNACSREEAKKRYTILE